MGVEARGIGGVEGCSGRGRSRLELVDVVGVEFGDVGRKACRRRRVVLG
jgi:hypothetical protein